jgi:hypothetical protein
MAMALAPGWTKQWGNPGPPQADKFAGLIDVISGALHYAVSRVV